MSGENLSVDDQNKFQLYEIRIKGHLDARWTDWFGDLVITLEKDGITCLSVRVIDQAALYGYLRKVRDLGMPLLSVICINPGQADATDASR
jgi:hypothetical protein